MDERGPLGRMAGPWNGGRQMIRHGPAAPTTDEKRRGRREGKGRGEGGKGPLIRPDRITLASCSKVKKANGK